MTLNLALRLGAVTGSSAWSPTNLTNLIAWWDASDAATFTYSSGSVVSQWNDKSGNSRHLSQGTVANQPNRNATLNSLSGVTFDGSNDFMDFDAGSDAIDISPWTCWAVVDLASAADTDRIFTCRRSLTGAWDFNGGQAIFLYRSSGTGTYNITAMSSTTASAASTGVSTAMIIGSRMSGSQVFSRVGATESSATSATAPVDVRYLRVGTAASSSGNPPAAGGNNFNGVLYEMFICNSNVTATDAVTYLQTKWGL